MAKSKQVKAPPVTPAQEGDIDPYAAGKHIANPEPDNGAANRPADEAPTFSNGQELPASDTPNADQEEQDEVAAGREETPSEEVAEPPTAPVVDNPASEPAPEAPAPTTDAETPPPVADPPVGEGETFEPSEPTAPTPAEIAEA